MDLSFIEIATATNVEDGNIIIALDKYGSVWEYIQRYKPIPIAKTLEGKPAINHTAYLSYWRKLNMSEKPEVMVLGKKTLTDYQIDRIKTGNLELVNEEYIENIDDVVNALNEEN